MKSKKNIMLLILKTFFTVCFFPFVLIYWCFKSGSKTNTKDDGLSMEEITDYEELMEE